MKNKKYFIIIFVFLLILLLSGCQKKIGIGSKNLYETYYGLSIKEVEKKAPVFIDMIGNDGDGFIIADEKGGFGLMLELRQNQVTSLMVTYNPSYGDKNQANMILNPPSDAWCYESQSSGALLQEGWVYYRCKSEK